LLLSAEPAAPSKNVNLEMDKLAERVARFVKEEGRDAVMLGAFTDRSSVPSNAGPGIAKQLGESLKRQGIQIRDNAALEVGGEYFTKVDSDEDRQAVYVRVIVRDDKKREVLHTGRRIKGAEIFGARAIASMLALTVDDLPPDEKDQDAKIRLAVAGPSDFINESRVAAGEKSPYALEIFVKQDGKYVPLRAVRKDGRAFVPLKKDDHYAVRLINDSPHDAAVVLSIDGLSLFAFQEEKETYSHFLIPAKSAGVIKGWYRTREQADGFTITGYADAAAAKALKYASSVGTITATFAVAWRESEQPPEGENSRDADIATGRGPNVDTDYRVEPRKFGRTRASISVRYAR
jgi:hypothetical protein